MNHHRRKRSFFSFSPSSSSSSSLAYRSLFAHRFETREASLIIARTSFNYDTPRSRKRIESSKPQGWYCRLEKEKSRFFFLFFFSVRIKYWEGKSCEGGNARVSRSRVNSSVMKGDIGGPYGNPIPRGTPGGENILLKTLLMAVIGLSAAKR